MGRHSHGHSKSYANHVVKTVGPTSLGLPTCRDMKFVTINHGISTKQHLCQIHKAMQMQGRSFFANARIAARELDASSGRPHGSTSHSPTTTST